MLAIKIPPRQMALLFVGAVLALLAGCSPPGPRALAGGDRLLRDGQAPAAVEKLRLATSLLPQEPRAWNLLGLAYHRSGQAPAAIQAYRTALLRDRSNAVAVAHFNLGCLLLEQNSLATAADELRSYTLLTNSLPGFLKLGAAQSRLRRWTEAEASFASALRLDKNNAEAWNGLGVIRVQRGQRDAAQYFNTALQSNPKYAPALLNSAILAQQQPATRPVALQRYRECLALLPSGTQSNAVRALVRQLEAELAPAPPSAPSTVAAANNARPASPPATNLLAAKSNALAAVLKTNVPSVAVTNRPAPAPAPVQPPVVTIPITSPPPVRIVPVEPVTPKPVVVVARTEPVTPPPPPPTVEIAPTLPSRPTAAEPKKPGFLSRLNPFGGKPKPPAENPPRTVVLNPKSEPPAGSATRPEFPRYSYVNPARPAAGDRASAQRALERALAAQRAGQIEEAAAAYGSAVTADPGYFEAQNNAALLAFQSGNLPKALSGWETALALEPESINTRYSFALALKQSGYATDAAVEFEKIVEAKPSESRAHLALGNLYSQQLAAPQKARDHYRKVLELEPRNPQAAAIRFWLAANP